MLFCDLNSEKMRRRAVKMRANPTNWSDLVDCSIQSFKNNPAKMTGRVAMKRGVRRIFHCEGEGRALIICQMVAQKKMMRAKRVPE